MPGPNSQPDRIIGERRVVGKTNVDRATGKHARHLQNKARAMDANRGRARFGGGGKKG